MGIKKTRAAAVFVGTAVALAGFALSAPAASADAKPASVTNCKKSALTFKGSVTGATVEGAVKRNCTVKYGAKTYYNQDFMSFVTRDTRCDNYGPYIWLKSQWKQSGRTYGSDWYAKNNKGCEKQKQYDQGWTAHQSKAGWAYNLDTRNSKKVYKQGTWRAIG
ncbi:hypothetical protein [Streptosporangium sp. KLBMP 9127]|nr:hypothetical protein [Streptosporangium sp. KLBMP 9127]